LTTKQANESRIVTACRYAVESVNGAIKQKFQYFNSVTYNKVVKTLFIEFRIACAIHNFTFKTHNISQYTDSMIDRMLQYKDQLNRLAEIIKEENLNSKTSNFRRLEDSKTIVFPRWGIEQLKIYTCGIYQLKNSCSYYTDHMKENGDFEFQIAREKVTFNWTDKGIDININNVLLLKARIKSRHSQSIKYFSYVLITKNDSDLSAIIGHSCNCKIGNSVVGCCLRVATIIWYFAHARYLEAIPEPAGYLDNFLNIEEYCDDDDDVDD